MSAVIALEQLSKVYDTGALQVNALTDITMSIDAGEYVAIMGPSGSGKSTLMHILGALDVPSSGTYLLAGEDVSRMSEAQLALVRNRRVGFVFQQFNLLPTLSAVRNVALPLTYSGVKKAERMSRAMEALDRVGLTDRADHRPGQLSGGQQQRVAIARAMVTVPDLLLADEPTGNLDTAASYEVMDLFDELSAAGRTIVLITHEPDIAARAQRQLRIRDGRLAGKKPVAA